MKGLKIMLSRSWIRHRKLKEWGISGEYRRLVNEANSIRTDNLAVNPYEYIRNAEDFAYSEAETQDVVLTEKWTDIKGAEYGNFCNGSGLALSLNTKQFDIQKNCRPGTVFKMKYFMPKGEKTKKVMPIQTRHMQSMAIKPLILRETNMTPWSILPIKYGVVDYINEQKQVLHILTQDSVLAFCPSQNAIFKRDTFVKFREFTKRGKDCNEIGVAEVCPCPAHEALPNMPSQIAVVDEVNEPKQLFHVVLGTGQISDIVKFEQTRMRPEVGDLLRITFCIKQNKEGKKYIKFLDMQLTDEENSRLKKTISGYLVVKYKHDMDCEPDFAFIDDTYYVHKSILKKYHIKDDCDVIARLVLSGDNKWKVYALELDSTQYN